MTQTAKTPIKKLGIMTSGGDCGGLNAAIRAIVNRAIGKYGWQVFGIKNATVGLMARPVNAEEFSLNRFDGTVLRKGGTILGSISSGDPFNYKMPDGTYKDRTDDIAEGYRLLGLDALITIGGDGSLAIARELAQRGGFNMVGIPKTIDNDVCQTETSIGYDTAVQVAVEALDKLQPTAASHNRVMILEVMGRDAGHIALSAGIAGGADIILIPELPYKIDNLVQKIKHVKETEGRNFCLIVVAEAVKTEDGTPLTQNYHGNQSRYGGIGQYLAEQLSQKAGAEARVTVLGHVQRGSQPSHHDRALASAFGVHAVDLVAQGKFDHMVAWQNRDVVAVPIGEVVEKNQVVDTSGALYRTARGLGISFGQPEEELVQPELVSA